MGQATCRHWEKDSTFTDDHIQITSRKNLIKLGETSDRQTELLKVSVSLDVCEIN